MDRRQWVAAALAVAVVAAAGLWYAGRSPAPPPLAVDPGGGGGRTITVHVSGAVLSPGVVQVAAGARVGEAIAWPPSGNEAPALIDPEVSDVR